MVTIDDVRKAREATSGLIRHTPLEHSPDLSRRTGGSVHMKLENLQVTGSFKPRGPFNRLLALRPEERDRGVVAATAGNHGVGLSNAGRYLGIPVHVHIPRTADLDKLEMLQGNGATLHFAESFEEAHWNSLAMAKDRGLVVVSAYNDPYVIASDGVIGLEILDDLPDIDLVVVPLGGGGLAAGIGLAMKATRPAIEVWAVEAANSPTFNTWIQSGETGPVDLQDSIAEGLAGYVEPETITWPLIKANVDQLKTATEAELVDAMRWMVTKHRMIIEPSGAAAVAVVLRAGEGLAGRRAAVLVSGGNIAWERFLGLLDAR